MPPLVIAAISSALVVLSQGAFAADDVQTQTLDAVNVTAEVLKIDTSTQDSPETVNVINSQEIKDKAVKKVDEALRYTPGYRDYYGSDYDTNWFSNIRGFEATLLVNGQRQFKDGFFDTTIEPYGVESIELLQGPNSLYGDAMPGGVINVVTKKPTKDPQKNITIIGGTNNYLLGGFDISDKVNEAGTARYRLVTSVSREDAELKGNHGWRAYVAPSVTFDITPSTSLTLLASYLKDDKIANNPFFPEYGTLFPINGHKLDRDTNFGDPSRDAYKKNQFNIGWDLTSHLNDKLTYNQKFNYQYQDFYLHSTSVYGNGLLPGTTPYEAYRYVTVNDGTLSSVTFDNNLTSKWLAGSFDNSVQVGFDYQWFNNKWLGNGVGFANQKADLLNPSVGLDKLTPGRLWNTAIRKQQIGTYIHGQTIWDETLLLKGGVRYDHVNIKDSWDNTVDHLQKDSLSDNNISWNIGLMYLNSLGISPYVNYSEAYYAQASLQYLNYSRLDNSRYYTLYSPITTKQWEVGLKITPDWLKGYMNIALYRIKQLNASVPGVADNGALITQQSGSQTADGIEFQLVAELMRGLNVNLGYAYINSKNTDKDGVESPTQQVGHNTASGWLSYNFAAFGIPQLTVASGLRYQGASRDLYHDQWESWNSRIPSATLWDGAITYQFDKHWKAQINATNITDKYYVTSAYKGTAYLGEGRTVRGTLSYDF